MARYIDGVPLGHDVKTFELLDSLAIVLGTNKRSLWPCLGGSSHDDNAEPTYGLGSGAAATQKSWAGHIAGSKSGIFNRLPPYLHAGGVNSYYFYGGSSVFMAAADNAHFSFGNGTIDEAFSIGAFVLPTEIAGSQRSILSKYDDTVVAELREWDLRFDTSMQIELELYDESANASEIATADTALTPFIWQLVVATYDGNEAAPDIHLYVDNVDRNSGGASVESGAYVAMEDLATQPLWGARQKPATVNQLFDGRMSLPFITGKELVQNDVDQILGLGSKLLAL